MKNLVYRGFIRDSEHGDNCSAIFIGECCDPIAEELMNEEITGRWVSFRYWVSDTEKADAEIKKGALLNLIGCAEADYGDKYSEATGYLWTEANLAIGGHDLLSELESYVGKYILLEIDVHSR